MVISFDFWGTIAKSNPNFKVEQSKLIGEDPVKYKSLTDELKRKANEQALNSDYPTLPNKEYYYPVDKSIREVFIKDSEDLFLKLPPNKIHNTVKVIRELLSLKKSSPHLKLRIGIVSNTGAIPGKLIKEYIFKTLKLRLDFFNFSDELEVCKPNSLMFDTSHGKVDLHIGNDPNYDNVEGIKYLDVKNLSIESILPIIHRSTSSSVSMIGKGAIVSNSSGTTFEELYFSLKEFDSEESINFNVVDYSKLKYGSGKAAESFGKLLSKGLVRSKKFSSFIERSKGKEILIASAPYKYLPVASTALKNEVHNTMVLDGVENTLLDFKVFRGHSYLSDYGEMDKDKRWSSLSGDSFRIDKDFIKDRSIIFVDDVKITGSHENRMRNLLAEAGYEGTVLYVYFAEFTGEGSPSIENLLNYAYIEDLKLDAIESIILTEKFIFNTRVTKYILNSSNEDFKRFIIKRDKAFQQELFVGAVNNGYLHVKEFQKNLSYLKELINYKIRK